MIRGVPRLFTEAPTHVAGAPRLAAGTPRLVAGTPRLVISAPRPVICAPRLVASAPSHVTGAPRSVAGAPLHMAGTTKIFANGPGPVAGASRLVAGTPRLLAGAPRLHASAPRLHAGTPRLVASAPRLVSCAPSIDVNLSRHVFGAPMCSQTYHNHSLGSLVPVIRDPSYSQGQPQYPARVWFSPEIDTSNFTLHILSYTPAGSQWLKYILLMKVPTNLSAMLYICSMKMEYYSSNKVNNIQQILYYETMCTGLNCIKETLSYLVLDALYCICSLQVINILSVTNQLWNTQEVHLYTICIFRNSLVTALYLNTYPIWKRFIFLENIEVSE